MQQILHDYARHTEADENRETKPRKAVFKQCEARTFIAPAEEGFKYFSYAHAILAHITPEKKDDEQKPRQDYIYNGTSEHRRLLFFY